MSYQELNTCLACGSDSEHLHRYLDLGKQPLANSNLQDKDAAEETYPLAVQYCDVCWHSQLTVAVDPKLLFVDYDYVSGTSDALKYHFDQCARLVSKCFDGTPDRKILDIASNDGTFLNIMNQYDWYTIGVDPAQNLAAEASQYADEIIVNFFTQQLGKELAARGNRVHVIMAQNVLAHVADPLDFLLGCRHALKPGGRIFIQTSQCNMVPKCQFDTIYHEHISYFSMRSMRHLADRAGLYVETVFIEPIHGDSYMFVLRLPENGHDRHGISVCRREMVEEDEGRYSHCIYRKLAEYADKLMMRLYKDIIAKRDLGMKIIGFGAAAKGNTLLNAMSKEWHDIGIEYIVDENPRKWNKYTPGTRIPIQNPDTLYAEPNNADIAVVLLAWNFANEIIKRVSANAQTKHIVFIKPRFTEE